MLVVDGFEVHYLSSNQQLADVASTWLEKELIALDTEFMRVRTYYPVAALFQVCDGEAIYLIDPVSVTDLEPLATVLRCPLVIKLMHSCSEDLEVCDRHLGALPAPLFDTQIAGSFCGLGLSMGYQRMLSEVLDLALEKSETRTDWLQRPLSDAQLRYAAEDVAYLPALYRALRTRLQNAGTQPWLEQECAAVLERFEARNPGAEYATVSGAWRLSADQLALLRALYEWRDETARSRDLPRNWVAPDKALLQLAQRQPKTIAQLGSIDDLAPGSVRRYGAAILQLITQLEELDPSEYPSVLPRPLSPAEGKQLKRLKAVITRSAERLNIAPEMIARRRDVEDVLRFGVDSDCPLMSGWRFDECGRDVLSERNGEQ